MIKKLLYLSNLSFLSLYLVLAWNNRFVNDDFCSIANLHQYGIIKGTEAMYNAYCTRWISVLFVHTVLSFAPYISVLFMVGIFTLMAIIFSFAYLLKNILSLFFKFHAERLLLLNLSIFSVNAFFYSTFDIGTSWFWLSSIPTYLWSFIFFSLGCGIILSSNKFRFIKDLILSLSFFYIGGSAEAFAAVVLLVLSVALIILHFSKLPVIEKKMYMSRLYLAFIFCLISLTILYSGHGNIVRRSLTGEISLLHALVLNVHTTQWIGLHWIIRVLPVIFLFSIPLLYAGKVLSWNIEPPQETVGKVSRKLLKAVVLYISLVFILNYPITYLICGISPARALVSASFLTWALFAFAFAYIGYKTRLKDSWTKYSVVFSLSLCLLFNSFNTAQQFTVTRNYAHAYNALMEDLKSKKETSLVIVVSPLPPSGMLPSINISEDSTSNYNRFIKQALGLKADIMLSK